MARTNVVIDDRLMGRVMKLYGLRTKREAIDFALRSLVGEARRRDMLEMEGSGWEGNLEELRTARTARLR
ncbi:MAG: type II toxin-antitoxin system VapB family antitoxin [Candidatus Limnocylindria bacterium]